MLEVGQLVPMKLTVDDYFSTPPDGKRYELIDGVMQVSPSPTFSHQRVVGQLCFALSAYIQQHAIGEVVTSPIDVVLSNEDVVQPDIVFVSAERLAETVESHITGPPDLVVEVTSPRTASDDRGPKQQLYARSGVKHYWIVDTQRPSLEAYRLSEAAYVLVSAVERDGVFEPELFPGLRIPLSDIWSQQ